MQELQTEVDAIIKKYIKVESVNQLWHMKYI